MELSEVKELLNRIRFSPSNINMDLDWDVKPTKISNESDIVIEKGYSIRTTFTRPSGNDIERGYGRWLYVPENASVDNIIKTAWLCLEIITKHELMNAFLYDDSKVFDPLKTVAELQSKVSATTEGVSQHSEQTSKVTSTPEEIIKYLDDNLIKKDNLVDGSMDVGIFKYIVMTYTVFHNPLEKMVRLVDSSNSKIIDYRSGEKYTLSEIKGMLGDLVAKSHAADSAEINQKIYLAGFTIAEPKDDFWIFKHPKINHRLIVHSESDCSLAVIDASGKIIEDTEGRIMVYENADYTIASLNKILSFIKM